MIEVKEGGSERQLWGANMFRLSVMHDKRRFQEGGGGHMDVYIMLFVARHNNERGYDTVPTWEHRTSRQGSCFDSIKC